MARPIQEPVTTGVDSPTHESKTTHPAYAAISASRVSGGARLYGSDFEHQNYIRIGIGPSVLHRGLSNDHMYNNLHGGYIEVDMSEAQWATFVSSLNVGTGVYCTLRYRDGVEIPGLPAPFDKRDQFKDEAAKHCEAGLKRLDDLAATINAMNISQKAKNELISKLDRAQSAFTGAVPFVLDQFGEHMEHTTEKAKIEVNAYITNALMQTGLTALQNGTQPKILGYDTNNSHDD